VCAVRCERDGVCMLSCGLMLLLLLLRLGSGDAAALVLGSGEFDGRRAGANNNVIAFAAAGHKRRTRPATPPAAVRSS